MPGLPWVERERRLVPATDLIDIYTPTTPVQVPDWVWWSMPLVHPSTQDGEAGGIPEFEPSLL